MGLLLLRIVLISLLWVGSAMANVSQVKINPDDVIIFYIGSEEFHRGMSYSVYDIDLDAEGNPVMAEFRQDRITIRHPDGKIIHEISATPRSHGVAVAEDGFLYIATHDYGHVLKYDTESKDYMQNWDKALIDQGHIKDPVAIDFDRDGNVYIADYVTKKIVKADSNGNYLIEIKTSSAGVNDFTPHDVRVVGENIYVANRHHSVCVFTTSGEFKTCWPAPDTFDPLAVAVAPNNIFLVPDYKSGVVSVFHNGKLTGMLGESGDAPGQFRAVTDVIIKENSQMTAFFVEEQGNRVQRIDLKPYLEQMNSDAD